jgi:hypothetical protein
MAVLDSKLTKSVGHFEENKFSVGCHKFLLECCPKLIKTYNFGQNAVNKRLPGWSPLPLILLGLYI